MCNRLCFQFLLYINYKSILKYFLKNVADFPKTTGFIPLYMSPIPPEIKSNVIKTIKNTANNNNNPAQHLIVLRES